MISKPSRIFSVLFLVAFFIVMPFSAHAATATFFGPIVPPECNCTNQANPNGGAGITTAPSYGCVLATVQNSVNFGITLGVIAATLALVFAGFIWMTSGGNPEARNRGRNMLLNVVIGLVILLSAWLVVDFVMKTLYNPDTTTSDGKKFGPWNSILQGSASDQCIAVTKPKAIAGIIGKVATGAAGGTGNQLNPVPPAPSGGTLGTTFTFDPGIAAQQQDASPKLQSLLSCMAPKLPSGIGRISSISDSAIVSGGKSFSYCDDNGCAHAAHSCHYGGPKCTGRSYAVDFGDDQDIPTLTAAARACNADFINNEGTHLHVSVGAACGCN